MPDEDWRTAAGNADRQPLDAIGEKLRLELGEIVDEPLPAQMALLLSELQRRRAEPGEA